MGDATGESSYEYDRLGRLIRSQDGDGDAVGWEYNLDNEPVEITYPNGETVSRSYDDDGRLKSTTDWLGNTTSFGYNKDSELQAITFPTGTDETDEYTYDPAGRMSGVTMGEGAGTLASLSYSDNSAGRLESLVSKGLPGAEEESFSYDENERVTKAGTAEFGYDDAGNVTEAPGTINGFDEASEIESAAGATFAFDEEGERTNEVPSSGPETAYEYDQAGELTAVERAEEGGSTAIAESLTYNGLGLLVSRAVGLSHHRLVWDQSASPELLLSDGEDSYIYGPRGLAVEQISPGGEPTYLHRDQIGSTRLLTNASGEASGAFTYGPYGALTGHTGPATTALGYAGQYTLAQSGLQYLRARFYDPGTAQFVTVDPAVEATGEPYAYAGDNPVRFKDPTGLSFAEALEEFGLPCFTCAGEEMVREGLEGVVHGAEWFLTESLGQEELDEGEGIPDEAEEIPCSPDRNWRQDKKVTERELKGAGLDAHELKELGSRSDIYKDREGNLYEKPKGGKGPGEPLGINIREPNR